MLFMLAKVFLGKPCSRDLGGLAAEAKLLPAPPAKSQLHSWDGLDGEGIFMNDKGEWLKTEIGEFYM